jgi:hypothetical protein
MHRRQTPGHSWCWLRVGLMPVQFLLGRFGLNQPHRQGLGLGCSQQVFSSDRRFKENIFFSSAPIEVLSHGPAEPHCVSFGAMARLVLRILGPSPRQG